MTTTDKIYKKDVINLNPYYDNYIIYDYGIKRCRPDYNTILLDDNIPIAVCKKQSIKEIEENKENEYKNKQVGKHYSEYPNLYDLKKEENKEALKFTNTDIYNRIIPESEDYEKKRYFHRPNRFDGTGIYEFKKKVRSNEENNTNKNDHRFKELSTNIYNYTFNNH
jgi:hypothetical protein